MHVCVCVCSQQLGVGVGARGQPRFGHCSVMSTFSHSAGLAHRVPCLRAGPRQCDTARQPRRIDGFRLLHHAVELWPGVFPAPPPGPPAHTLSLPLAPPSLSCPPCQCIYGCCLFRHAVKLQPGGLSVFPLPSPAQWANKAEAPPSPDTVPPSPPSVFPPCPRPFPAQWADTAPCILPSTVITHV